MPRIGTFTRNEDGFFGDIRTLMLRAKFSILPADNSGAENAPDHRVFCDGTEIGAAWERTGEKAGSYLSVVIDDPSFPRPIHARLFQSDAGNGAWTQHWSRPSRSEERN